MFTLETFLYPLIGGVLIGLASLAMLLFNGRIAGISGIVGGLLSRTPGDNLWRLLFLGGLFIAGVSLTLLWPAHMPSAATIVTPTPWLIVAGILVGFGARLGSGCTSGHGVCGISRFSVRSVSATLTFMFTGALMVLIVRLISGGAA